MQSTLRAEFFAPHTVRTAFFPSYTWPGPLLPESGPWSSNSFIMIKSECTSVCDGIWKWESKLWIHTYGIFFTLCVTILSQLLHNDLRSCELIRVWTQTCVICYQRREPNRRLPFPTLRDNSTALVLSGPATREWTLEFQLPVLLLSNSGPWSSNSRIMVESECRSVCDGF